jgi:hypothetical protein
MVIWYFFSILVCCTKKNLATLVESRTLNIGRSLPPLDSVPIKRSPISRLIHPSTIDCSTEKELIKYGHNQIANGTDVF